MARCREEFAARVLLWLEGPHEGISARGFGKCTNRSDDFYYPTLLSVSSSATCSIRILNRKLPESGLYHNTAHTSIFVRSDRSKGAFLLEGTSQAPLAGVYESITAFICPHRVSLFTEKAPEIQAARMCVDTHRNTHAHQANPWWLCHQLPPFQGAGPPQFSDYERSNVFENNNVLTVTR